MSKQTSKLATVSNKNCSFTPTLEDLSCKANKAIYALLSKLPLSLTPVKILIKMFDTCIAPILLYGSEVWGPFTNTDWEKWDSTQIEKVHTQFLKRILGVNRSTTNVLVRSELGRHSLLENITTRNINYIIYIENKNITALVKQAANYEITMHNRNNLYSIFTKQEEGITNHDLRQISRFKLNALIKRVFDNTWSTYITSFTKADTFRLFKNVVKFEPYLEDIKNRKYRTALYPETNENAHSAQQK